MALISNGIDRVRAFELPAGVWSSGKSVGAPRAALITWCSSWADKHYQVYVNGQYAGVTVDSLQRQMLVRVPASFETPVRIEVFGVEANEVDTDFSDEMELSPGLSGRVRITLLRGQGLPIDSTVNIYFDNGMGEIDYDNPITELPIRVWPNWQDKAGFGMSEFGVSDFGYDSAAAVGYGVGSFGRGQFGLDADTLEWISGPLKYGVYKFAVKVADERGNESMSETRQVTVTPLARPAEKLGISSFDKQTNQLVLSIS
ncbi:MAG TPA: hypothetical protein VMX13_10370 [Sedimentisphaerales bacterium]|nr:hypothetical protein [Sedimentisphaerales bacterium]